MASIHQQLANASTTHYHTGVFNCKRKALLTGTFFVALTLLAIGVLALLHAQGILKWDALGSIPIQATYTMIAAGGILSVVGLGVLIYSRRQGQQIKEQITCGIQNLVMMSASQVEDATKIMDVKMGPKRETPTYWKCGDGDGLWGASSIVIVSETGQLDLHLFSHFLQRDAYGHYLDSIGATPASFG